MTQYIVHIYREMRLTFAGIEADTPEAAAVLARAKPTGDADDIDDCEGENLAALVDLAGDEDYNQSVTVDFEAGQPSMSNENNTTIPCFMTSLPHFGNSLNESRD